jgi:tetratricopeptide (TPR) repeat protein
MKFIRSLKLAVSFACTLPFPLAAHEAHSHGADKTDVTSLIKKGDALMQRSRDLLDPSLYQHAEAAYRQALAADPKCVPAMLGLAWVHNSEHEFAEGRRWAELVLEVVPKQPDAFALIGDGQIELGDYDGALESYQKALDIRPDQSSYSRAAHLLWLTGDTARARSLMRMAISAGSIAPENTAWCRARLALMFYYAGDIEEADRMVTEALRASPDNAHVLTAAGRVRAARGQLHAAIDAFERSIKVAPGHDALAALVDLYAAVGRDEEARAQADTVIAFHGGHGAVHSHAHDHGEDVHGRTHASHELALFLANHDRDIEAALVDAEAEYAAFPNVFAADALAWCQFKVGRTAEAAATIEKALSLGTPIAEIQFHAGMIFAKLGDTARADPSGWIASVPPSHDFLP